MSVDSFKYLSRLITRCYKLTRVETELPIPWSPLTRPLDRSRFGPGTSGGLYHRAHEPPFNLGGSIARFTSGEAAADHRRNGALHWEVPSRPTTGQDVARSISFLAFRSRWVRKIGSFLSTRC